MDPTAMAGFKSDQVAALDPTAMAGFKQDQVSTDSSGGFQKDQVGGLAASAVGGFKKDQVAAIDPTCNGRVQIRPNGCPGAYCYGWI